MTWNYRIVRKTVTQPRGEQEQIYGIHEVYYDALDKPYLVTVDPISVYGESPEEVVETLRIMLSDAEKHPVINFEDIPASEDWDPAGGK